MRTRVTNLSRGARGFHTAAGTVMLDPGASASLDLVDHPAHAAWTASGEVAMAPEEEAEPAASRVRPAARAGSTRSRDA